MYCSTCGNSLANGLIFCNQCGARAVDEEKSGAAISESSFNLMIAGLIAIPVVGLGIIIGLLSVMKKELGFGDEMILFIVMMSFALLITTEATLVWLMLHRLRPRKKSKPADKSNSIPQLDEVVIKGLSPGRESWISNKVPSVVDNTTRNLEPVYREPRKD